MKKAVFKTMTILAVAGCLLASCGDKSRIDAPGDNSHNLPDRILSQQDTSFIDDWDLLLWPNATDVISADSAVKICKQMPPDQLSSKAYKVVGYISALGTRGDNGGPIAFSYGNAYFDIKSHPWSRGSIQCFQIMGLNGEKYASNDQVYIGQRVIIESKLTNYHGTTPETEGQGKAKVLAWSWRENAPSTTGNGTKENPYTAADIKALGASLSQEFRREGDTVWVTGYINGAYSATDKAWTIEQKTSISTNVFLNDQAFSSFGQTAADTLAVKDGILPVAFTKTSPARKVLNLSANPDILSKKALIKGVLGNCLGGTINGVTYTYPAIYGINKALEAEVE